MTAPWLTIIGIGEDGIAGLSTVARTLLEDAEVIFGGVRHLAMLPPGASDRRTWVAPFADNIPRLLAERGRRVCVLASGDPQWFGVGATFTRFIPPAETRVMPHPGAFSLAAARLGWALQDCLCLTIHGRPLESLALHLFPGARLLVLSENAQSPAQVAGLLTVKGWGGAHLTVLERLGGPAQRVIAGTAADWSHPPGDDLNCLAITLGRGPGLARVPGLPNDAFVHDGQLTKREIRAVTLASLAPWPGAVLWDVGAGCGSIAIEWARAGGQAVAIEREPSRRAMIAANAAALGVPGIDILAGSVPEILHDLDPRPDAIFIGGGVTAEGVLERCWRALPPGGRLVVNAVTAEAEVLLLRWQADHGGELSRLAVSRLSATGRFHTWHSMMPVTHYLGIKP